MNPARLTSLMEAYAVGLLQAIKDSPKKYALKPDDTLETRALRTAMTVAGLIETRGLGSVDVTGDGFRNACKHLRIPHQESALQAYLDGE